MIIIKNHLNSLKQTTSVLASYFLSSRVLFYGNGFKLFSPDSSHLQFSLSHASTSPMLLGQSLTRGDRCMANYKLPLVIMNCYLIILTF